MVSTYSSQPFSMTADTTNTTEQGQITRQNSELVTTTRIKSELTWSQLVHAEIIGKVLLLLIVKTIESNMCDIEF